MATEGHDPDQRIAEAIRSLADDDGRLTSPPPNLWGRIERAIDDPPDDLVAPPDDLWDRIADEVRTEEHPPARAVRHPIRWMSLVAAIVAVCAIAAAVIAGRDGGGVSRSEVVARASLSGKGLDPGGDGTGAAELVQRRGEWKVDIQVSDLPAPPAGMFYEAWLLGSDARQVQSLGTLNGRDGFAVPDGLAIEDFPVVDVSIEPIDGNPAHSTKSVLRGRLTPS